MPPTTLLEFYTGQNSQLTNDLSTAQAVVISRQSTWSAAVKTRDDLLAGLAKITSDIADVRKQLATALPPDIDGLKTRLQDDIIQSRKLNWQVLEANRAITVAKAELDVATSEAQRLTAALNASSVALKNAQDQDKRRTALKTALKNPPLSTISADAANLQNKGTLFNDAQTRLQNDISPELFAQAEDRLGRENTRFPLVFQELFQSQDSVGKKQADGGGKAGRVSQCLIDLQQSEDALTGYVINAANLFNRAKTLLAKVADPTISPLTNDERTRIQDNGAAKTAAALEAVVNQAVQDLDKAQVAFDQAIRNAISDSTYNEKNPPQPVKDATTARDIAQGKLDKAKGDYKPANQNDARAWEAAVPDSTWQLLADFENANDFLSYLQHPGVPDTPDDPQKLLTDLNNAETALVAALVDADNSDRATAALQTEVAKWSAITKWELTATNDRRFSAIRGDF